MTHRVLISGCSGGGKSTLLAELERRGYAVVEEPGRRIVDQERKGDGAALPWVDMARFAQRAVDMSRDDIQQTDHLPGPVFFDRGLIDAAVALAHASNMPLATTLGPDRPYADPIFLAPPWPEIFQQDAARRHDMASAIAEFERLTIAFAELGYATCNLPKAPVSQRADFVLDALGAA